MTQIVDEPEAGPSSVATNPVCKTEIGPLEFEHIGPSFKNFGQDEVNEPLYHNIRKEVVDVNRIPMKRKAKGRGPRVVRRARSGAASGTSKAPEGCVGPSP